MQAATVAVRQAREAGLNKLAIHTDSQFLIDCATKEKGEGGAQRAEGTVGTEREGGCTEGGWEHRGDINCYSSSSMALPG